MAPSDFPSDVGPAIPADLRDFVTRWGGPVTRAHEVTTARSLLHRGTLRVEFADGRVAKARRFARLDWAEQMDRIHSIIGPVRWLTAPIHREGRLLLEEWIEGDPLDLESPTGETARRAGGILACLHRVPVPSDQAVAPNVAGELEQTLARLADLSRWLTPVEIDELRRLAVETAPTNAALGFIHVDFCGENLVRHATRGLVCIDNETLRVGPFGLDLGRTLYRWSLSNEARDAFVDGYVRAGGPAELEGSPFWTLVAEAWSAHLRNRDNFGDIEGPIRALKRRL